MNHFSDSDYLVRLPQFTALYEISQANGDKSPSTTILTSSARPSAVSLPLRLHGHLSTGSWPTSPKSIGLLSGEVLKQG
jgi:hypothetical protein